MNSERGNVFLFVLLGLILFAALAFVVSRGMRSETTTGISQRQAELAAVDILDYAQRLQRAVAKLSSRGVSENDIDFTNTVVAGYGHTPATPLTSRIFEKTGGSVSWKEPEERANDGSHWMFTGETCIVDIGTGGTGCETDADNNEELLAVLPNLKLSVCTEINKRLNITPMPSGGSTSTSQFTGSYGDDSTPTGTDGLSTACFVSGGNYTFYSVLLAR
jgi:hypothetical protein